MARWSSTAEDAEVELELPGGMRLRFRAGTDVAYLAALVARLG